MVWNGKGRSGIGDKSINGTWDDWDGLSPNGKQFKNPLTKEIRNLSGAEYWSARKADNPYMLNKALPHHFNANGSANIKAYVEPEKPKSSKKEEPLEYKLYPQQKAYDKLEALVQDIERKYLNLEISDEEYTEAMDVLEPKLAKAWTALCKAKGWWEECGELSPEEKAIQKEKERVAQEYLNELKAHNRRIERELKKGRKIKTTVKKPVPFLKVAWVIIAILIVKSFFAIPV